MKVYSDQSLSSFKSDQNSPNYTLYAKLFLICILSDEQNSFKTVYGAVDSTNVGHVMHEYYFCVHTSVSPFQRFGIGEDLSVIYEVHSFVWLCSLYLKERPEYSQKIQPLYFPEEEKSYRFGKT